RVAVGEERRHNDPQIPRGPMQRGYDVIPEARREGPAKDQKATVGAPPDAVQRRGAVDNTAALATTHVLNLDSVGPGGAGPAVGSAGDTASAAANSAAPPNRSAGTFASALATAASMPSGTVSRTVRIRVGRSVSSFAITAWTVGPVCGGSPASIS